jgi:hypothetical protein
MPHKKDLTTTDLDVSIQLIERRIYLIRGHKVMIDVDLAQLYGVPTKGLNQRVQKSEEISGRFYVPANRGRSRGFEITIYDLKARPWRSPLPSLCIHGTGCRHVVECS